MTEDNALALDQLMLRHAHAGLVLVEPVGGRVVALNATWPQWLGCEPSSLQGTVIWEDMGWPQPELVRTLISLTSLPLPMPPMPVSAWTREHVFLPLVLSCELVDGPKGRLVMCTLVRDRLVSPPAMTASVSENALMGVVQALTTVLEVHDPESIGHQRRVADLVGTLARQLQWSIPEVESVTLAALIHDLGMVTVSPRVLGKLDLLSGPEVMQIQRHVTAGVNMIEHIEFPGPVTTLIAQHHERINGSGYPLGLKGDEVSRGAQLIGMADMLDAMTRNRPYQPAQTLDQALQVLLVSGGVLFDADLVQACFDLFVQDGYRFPAI